MADYNRKGSYRSSNQDWNDDHGRSGRYEDERYRGRESRGYGSGDYDMGSGWQSRYEREDYNQGGYGSGRYGRHNEESDYGQRDHTSEREYGYGGNYGRGNYGRTSRNLYDRDYEGMGRSGYSRMGTRLGGANYGGYGDYGRYNEGRFEGGHYGGHRRDDYRDRHNEWNEDRNWWDRTRDEVSSWFGDEDAERRREHDRIMNHRGKGPKNYIRSDERIKDDINDRLSDDPFIDASDIDVTVTNGDVTLTGTVEDRSAKRRAEDIAEAVTGVKNVENRLRVGVQSSDYPNPELADTTGPGRTGTDANTSAVPGSERERAQKSYVSG